MQHDDNGIRRIVYVRTIDGDTFVGNMLLAPQIRPKPLLEIAIRVEGWSAAELNEAEGEWFRARFEEKLMDAHVITVRMKVMSFNRIVAAVFLDDLLFAGILHEELRKLRMGHRP